MNIKEKHYLKYFLINIFIGIVFVLLILLYSQNFTQIGWLDALFVAGILLISVGWFLFISNANLFGLMIYGFKSFWTNVAGRRMKHTYIEYIQEKQKIESSIYYMLWLAGFVYELIFVVLYLIINP